MSYPTTPEVSMPTCSCGATRCATHGEHDPCSVCAMTWQPIETAPKDGTEILVGARWSPGGGSAFRVAFWCDAWGHNSTWARWGDHTVIGLDFSPDWWRPILPLPEPLEVSRG